MKNKLLALCLVISTSVFAADVPPFDRAELKPAGAATTKMGRNFLKPLGNLRLTRQDNFWIGQSFFADPWVRAPSITSDRDGLGPLFNMRSCLACHTGGGRGLPPVKNGPILGSMLVRTSIPGEDEIHGSIPEPTYGFQFQSMGIDQTQRFGLAKQDVGLKGRLVGEAVLNLAYSSIQGHYPDGTSYTLVKPTLTVAELSYGPLHTAAQFSLRLAPPLLGMGLLESISESDIRVLADPEDVNADGISGRVNEVWNVRQGKTVLGRLGLKSNMPDVHQQTAVAFREDIGITNSSFPDEACTSSQQHLCESVASGKNQEGLEIPDKLLDPTVFFVQALGVPERRNAQSDEVMAGRALFYQANCVACHQPSFVTAENSDFPELGGQKIWPYTDLLLHDMGEGLADGRNDFKASGREWRTAPLWGVGMMKSTAGMVRLLHDGRARSVEEAILWHDGEAKNSREKFMNLTQQERKNLIAFVNSL